MVLFAYSNLSYVFQMCEIVHIRIHMYIFCYYSYVPCHESIIVDKYISVKVPLLIDSFR